MGRVGEEGKCRFEWDVMSHHDVPRELDRGIFFYGLDVTRPRCRSNAVVKVWLYSTVKLGIYR